MTLWECKEVLDADSEGYNFVKDAGEALALGVGNVIMMPVAKAVDGWTGKRGAYYYSSNPPRGSGPIAKAVERFFDTVTLPIYLGLRYARDDSNNRHLRESQNESA